MCREMVSVAGETGYFRLVFAFGGASGFMEQV
jgi:hypothetical protein